MARSTDVLHPNGRKDGDDAPEALPQAPQHVRIAKPALRGLGVSKGRREALEGLTGQISVPKRGRQGTGTENPGIRADIPSSVRSRAEGNSHSDASKA